MNHQRYRQMPTRGSLNAAEQDNLKGKWLDRMIVWNRHYQLGISTDQMWDLIPDLMEDLSYEVILDERHDWE
jgi:hypothetical protein